jgi:hypothetical protein
MRKAAANRKLAAHRFGLAAETLAAFYLRCKGYRILAQRYRNAQGEIDLLARKGATLVAVEVKARRSLEACDYSVPLEAGQNRPRSRRRAGRPGDAESTNRWTCRRRALYYTFRCNMGGAKAAAASYNRCMENMKQCDTPLCFLLRCQPWA